MTLWLPEIRAFEPLLNRAEAAAHLTEHFPEIPPTLSSLVDYGTHLIPRCFLGSRKELPDIIALIVLLKQMIALLDGAELLLAGGAVQPAVLQLRAMFEVSVYLEWVLAEDTSVRTRAYYVWNLRRRRMWAKRIIAGTPEARTMESHLAGLELSAHLKSSEAQAAAAADIVRVDEELALSQNTDLNSRFDERRGRRAFDPEWYAACYEKGTHATFKTLCTDVGRLPEYQLIYEMGSEAAHSSRTDIHYRIAAGKIGWRSLRELTDLGLVAQFLMGQAIHTYGKVLAHYRPQESQNFARAYVEHWRKAFLNRKSVNYEYVERPL